MAKTNHQGFTTYATDEVSASPLTDRASRGKMSGAAILAGWVMFFALTMTLGLLGFSAQNHAAANDHIRTFAERHIKHHIHILAKQHIKKQAELHI